MNNKFFFYNGKVINLDNVAEFEINERGGTQEKPVVVNVIFNYSHGWIKEEGMIGGIRAETRLDRFATTAEAEKVISEIIEGQMKNPQGNPNPKKEFF